MSEKGHTQMQTYPVTITRSLGFAVLATTTVSAALFLIFAILGVNADTESLILSVSAFMCNITVFFPTFILILLPTYLRFSLGVLPTVMSTIIGAAAIGSISMEIDSFPVIALGSRVRHIFFVCITFHSLSSILQASFYTYLLTCRYWMMRQESTQNTVYGNPMAKSTTTFGSSFFSQQNTSAMRVPTAATLPPVSVSIAIGRNSEMRPARISQEEEESIAWAEAQNAAFYATPPLPREDSGTGLGIIDIRPRLADSIIVHSGEDTISYAGTDAMDEAERDHRRDTYYPSPQQLNLSPVTRFSMLYKPVRQSVILRFNQIYPEDSIRPGEPNVHPAILRHPRRDEFGSLDEIEAAGVDLTLTKTATICPPTSPTRPVIQAGPAALIQHKQKLHESPPQRAVRPVAQDVSYIVVPNFKFGGKPSAEEEKEKEKDISIEKDMDIHN